MFGTRTRRFLALSALAGGAMILAGCNFGDLSIAKNSGGPFVGDEVNQGETAAPPQIKSRTVAIGEKAKFFVKCQSDNDSGQVNYNQATAGNADFEVKYKINGAVNTAIQTTAGVQFVTQFNDFAPTVKVIIKTDNAETADAFNGRMNCDSDTGGSAADNEPDDDEVGYEVDVA